jgi:hypothetical protein
MLVDIRHSYSAAVEPLAEILAPRIRKEYAGQENCSDK